MSDPNDSIPRLFGDAIEQLSKLVHNEVELARCEISQIVSRAGKGAAMIAAAGLVFVPTAVMLMIALALFLTQQGFSPVASYLLVTGVGLLAMVILAMAGMSYLKVENLKLKVTSEQLARDVATAKELAR